MTDGAFDHAKWRDEMGRIAAEHGHALIPGYALYIIDEPHMGRWNSAVTAAKAVRPSAIIALIDAHRQVGNEVRLEIVKRRSFWRRTARRYVPWLALAVFLLLALAGVARAQMTPAAAPQDAVRRSAVIFIAAMTPAPQYARWYAVAEACTGLKGNYKAVRWYMTPAPWSDGQHGNQMTYGMWQKGHRITLNAPELRDSSLVVHEIIHDLTSYHRDQFPDSVAHPAALFHDGGCSEEFHTP